MKTSWQRNPRSFVAIALTACLLACLLSPVNQLFSQEFLIQRFQCWGHWSFGGFILIYTLLTAIGIPGTIMTIVSGTVFGLFWGTLLSVVGATFGAIAAFWTARYLLQDWMKSRFGKHKTLQHFNGAVQHHPWRFVFALRFAPISPFNLVNFLFGLTPIHWLPYSVGTFFGIIPGTLAYTWLGVTGSAAWTGGDRLPFVLALGFIALLSALPLWLRSPH